jgi:hypothetical protein
MNAHGREPAPLVLPVGHYQGAFHAGGGRPPSYHVVRMGWEPARLDDEAEVDVWGLAHGLPAAIEPGGAWTRSSVLEAAAEVGHADASPVLDRLLGRGLVAEVAPGSAAAREFARYHRLQPLLIGLGPIPEGSRLSDGGEVTDEPLDALGVPGLTIAARVRPRVFEVWEWAHLWPDLWSASEGLAAAGREAGGTDEAATDPEQVLAFVLAAAQTLVAHGAAYLDHRPRTGPHS